MHGQATGNAAALALRAGIEVQALDPALVVAAMQAQGLRGLETQANSRDAVRSPA